MTRRELKNNPAYTKVVTSSVYCECLNINAFAEWLTDGKQGGALEMLDKYRIPEEKSKRIDNMKGVLV